MRTHAVLLTASLLVRPWCVRACDEWLETIYLASVSADDSGSMWTELDGLLTYLDEHVRLTVTTCSGSRRLAFKTFITCNSTGKPLTQVDLLKALLVQNLPCTNQREGPARKWELLSTELDALERRLKHEYADLWHTVVAAEGKQLLSACHPISPPTACMLLPPLCCYNHKLPPRWVRGEVRERDTSLVWPLQASRAVTWAPAHAAATRSRRQRWWETQPPTVAALAVEAPPA